jgi:ABC-type Fe3+/spermidine/putrescine transport system ATPase subunit
MSKQGTDRTAGDDFAVLGPAMMPFDGGQVVQVIHHEPGRVRIRRFIGATVSPEAAPRAGSAVLTLMPGVDAESRFTRADRCATVTAYLSIDDLSIAYGAGAPVLDRVSLAVQRGEMVALLGASGCGKTSLLRAIAGFVAPRSGRIVVDGREITQLPPEARGTAMMFQSYALWPHMDVAANIGYGLRMRGQGRAQIAERVAQMLKLLQLDGFERRSVASLSGGQKQRVAMGRALAVDPLLLLLDEPMSNLDYKVRMELRHELRALQKRVGITAIYVTHDREEALTLADRIAVIDAGRVLQYGPPQEVFHRPASPFVAGFMGADNAIRLPDGQRAHFRADRARLSREADPAALSLEGTIEQAAYLGHGWRYRVRLPDGPVWVDDPEAMAEGSRTHVIIAHDALLTFPQT